MMKKCDVQQEKKNIYILPKVSHDYYGKKNNKKTVHACPLVSRSFKKRFQIKKTSPNTWDFQPFFSGLMFRQSANIYIHHFNQKYAYVTDNNFQSISLSPN